MSFAFSRNLSLGRFWCDWLHRRRGYLGSILVSLMMLYLSRNTLSKEQSVVTETVKIEVRTAKAIANDPQRTRGFEKQTYLPPVAFFAFDIACIIWVVIKNSYLRPKCSIIFAKDTFWTMHCDPKAKVTRNPISCLVVIEKYVFWLCAVQWRFCNLVSYAFCFG